MLPEDRFSRQRRVSEVGGAGQALLCRLTVTLPPSESTDATLPGGDFAEVAASYLGRAGVRVERCAARAVPAFPHEHHFQDSASRALARGAQLALAELRRALGLDGPPKARERVLFP